MNGGDYSYIWQASDWPIWRFDLVALARPMAEVSRAQGLLLRVRGQIPIPYSRRLEGMGLTLRMFVKARPASGRATYVKSTTLSK